MKLKISLKKIDYPDDLFIEYKEKGLIDKINEIDTIFKKDAEIIIVESDEESMQTFLTLLMSYNLLTKYEYYE